MNIQNQGGFKAPVFASLALAFASFGDAFLYPFLPVNAAIVGVPVVWIGVLLSINRFVRIFSNSWMVHLFAKYGLRFVTIMAVLVAIMTTAGYALATSIIMWLVLRVAWGLSFSAMRISTLGYALQQQRQGVALGLSRGIQESGPTVALFLVPVLLNNVSTTVIFLLLAGFSLPALYFAWSLPMGEDKTPTVVKNSFFKFPSVLNSITLVSSFLIDGIIVVVLGVLFLHYKGDISLITATTLAAIYLGYRRICLVAFSPTGGWMADVIGLGRVFNLSLAAVIIGLTILTFGWIELGAIIVFAFYSILVAITPGKISYQQTHQLSAVAENATWRDIGAAVGTLTGGFLLTSNYLSTILTIAIFSLTLLLIIHLGKSQTTFKILYLWK